ncbi:beta-ketoacyl synthase N-terminal-like domain-containing protein [Sorangium sp. So ce388]|uniref:beta-ketoacyl synthase N-terminal-like domain-containing protein n=1 Tax=Sorangium sp. So ce388 TaxID=3133309 RepID=UPI003F5B8088
MRFEPIAIVGQGCVLPGALSPRALHEAVRARRCAVTGAPEGRLRLSAAHAMGPADQAGDRMWSDAGGYVEGFEPAFDAAGFRIDEGAVRALDPSLKWVLHAGREALRPLGHDRASARAGLVLGNLSFPTPAMARYAESVWLDAQGAAFLDGAARGLAASERPDPRSRFMSGLPASLAAEALGLGGGGFALDAACASSLYAIKLACDRLHDRTADLMLAGAVNAADPLFLHMGFCALAAMSRSGTSRPFHRDADGLVPAEGAAFVALKRLADARAAGDRVLGVIRGIGLSNDGRGRGLLSPSEEGQIRAMRLAYAAAGLTPADVSLIECHATGTLVGDATEVRSTAAVFEGQRDVPIGSLKSNLGHLITAAGAAGLMKVLGALEAGVRPATLHAEAPIEALRGSPFRLLAEEEPWPSDRPRVAAVSAFGFGGNNAHLLVSQDDPGTAPASFVPARPRPAVAIVGIGAMLGDTTGAPEAARAVLGGEPWTPRRAEVAVAQDGLRFPPRDLEQTLPQQLLVFEAAREATAGLSVPRERTGVLVGMGCDPEVARYGLRWRLADLADAWSSSSPARAGHEAPPDWLGRARDAVLPKLTAVGVLGTMPNIPANRISSQLDLGGPGYTVSAEQASGVVALEIAARALREGELDAAVVAAVDLSDEPVHRAALSALGLETATGDAAVALVLKRLDDARRDGDHVLAELDEEGAPALRVGDGDGAVDPLARGAAHAAAGLLHVAAAAWSVHHGARPAPHSGARGAAPWFGVRTAETRTRVLGGADASVRLSARGPAAPLGFEPPPRLFVYGGADRASVLRALAEGRPSESGPARLVLVAADEEQRAARAAQARLHLEKGGPAPEGVAYRDAPAGGQLAFVFTGAAASYAGMGRELALAMPDVTARLGERFASMDQAARWIFDPPVAPSHPLDQLWASAFLCQLHAEVSRRVLGLTPDATVGYSSGESNALFATGAWRDLDAMIRDCSESPVFTTELVGEFAAARRAWRKLGGGALEAWKAWSVAAPIEAVREALRGEPLAHLTIVNTPEDCVIGGEASACERVIERLGRGRAMPLGYEMAAHCPEIEEIREAWYDLHHRATWEVPGVRHYSAGRATAFQATSEAAAEAITAQALGTLDFPRMIERAWADGVRVFLEHGPRGLCSGWIRRILGDREHVAVPLDVAGRSGVQQLANAAAWLIAAGVPVDRGALERSLGAAGVPPAPQRATLKIPAHPPAIRLPPLEQWMAPAPRLVPVLDDATAAPVKAPAPSPVQFAAPAQARAAVPSPVQAAVPSLVQAAPPSLVQAAPPSLVQAAPPSLVQAAPPAPARLSARSPATSSGSPAGEIVARATEQQARLGALHREFLASQATAHAQFLALQQGLLGRFLRAYGPAVSPPPPPPLPSLPPVAPPLPSLPRAGEDTGLPAPAPVSPSASPDASAVDGPVGRRPLLPGPKLDRAQLEVLASGKISSVFGPAFAEQDGFHRQVRMPMPPLLLADRVTGIDATPGSMGTGTLWTETDVTEESWYLHVGRMPAGIMIEAGQADLLLISWLGADRLNRGERVYRLLGCELTYHGELPEPGDTLAYDIHVDGHAKQEDIRLFFFHYDCRIGGALRLSVRSGQAGFFTDAELAASGGVLWDAATAEHDATARLDPPAIACTKRSFTADDVRAFADGRAADCFGPGYERARTHVRSPRIQSGPMLLLREVTELDPRGGPWGRGYLRAEAPISPDDWYFTGHFLNDPCMPGTLMFEGCLQAMAFYLAGMGFAVDRDGWRFEPVTGHKIAMRCRGQAIPSSRRLVYEVFVEEIVAGPVPTVYADLLCTVDGLKAFHARRAGLKLVPGWPLDEWSRLPLASAADPAHHAAALDLRRLGGLRGFAASKPPASHEGFPFDYPSLLACAWGRPSAAFGAMYAPFDGPRKVARLPGPPYHFMSRITRADAPPGQFRVGVTIEAEYDIPAEAWYFDESGHPTMPCCVLMEATLQPCGWLASYVGSALTTDTELLFRNLDGTATMPAEILPTAGTLRTRVKIVDISRSAGMIIQSFEVESFVGETVVFRMNTVFGFFPKEAFDNQVGLPVSAEDRARIDGASPFLLDLRRRPARYFDGAPRLPAPMLCMLDRITAWAPEGGKKGLGWARGEKDVDPAEWFFKAHFFQDPVQPGSLGIEALVQLLQFAMIERNMGDGVPGARFEPIAIDRPLVWKYRGQVVPANRRITTEIDILEVGEDARGRFAVAEGSLWVDGKRIYHARQLAMRIVPGGEPAARAPREEILDPAIDTWLGDHRPTWTLPALPMMSMLDRLAGAATRDAARGTAQRVLEIADVQVQRWLPFPGGPERLRAEVSERDGARHVTLLAFREARDAALSRFEPVATGLVRLGAQFPSPPAPFPPLHDAAATEDPYASGALFHGPSFQMVRSLRLGAGGASALLDAAERGVPRGALHQGLLDALTHAIPHDDLARWSPDITDDHVGYPYRIPSIRFFGELPVSGEAQVEVRFAGFDGEPRFPRFDVQLLVGGAVRAALTLVDVLLPKGPIGRASRAERRAFLRDRRFVPGVRLARVRVEDDATVAALEDVKPSDWLPGNVARIYGAAPGGDLVAEVAVRDHVARRAFVHPSAVRPSADLTSATAAMRPLRRHALRVARDGHAVRVTEPRPPAMDLSPVEAHWRAWFGIGAWPVEDLYYGLIERFVGDVVIADPEAWGRARGRSCLYLANHQVAVESLLFSVLVSALSGVSTVTLAKAEHRGTWVGELIRQSFTYPGITDPGLITFFDREDRDSLMRIIGDLAIDMAQRGKNVMVHVEGTRALSCRKPVVKMSSSFIDMALAVGAPIVPVRFVGGLPVEELPRRLEFPLGCGRQDFWIGRPLLPEELSALPLKERKQVVIDAINGLGPAPLHEEPTPPDPAFADRVDAWVARTGASPERATLLATLDAQADHRSEATRRLVEGARAGQIAGDASPEGRWLAGLARWLLGAGGAPEAPPAP